MGHTVNPISTRLGWFDSWKDEIYLDSALQCDYVHHFIRVRALMVYIFFAKRPWDDFIVIFSHFNLFKLRRTINLIIYAYFGKVMLFGIGYCKYFLHISQFLDKKRFVETTDFRCGSIAKLAVFKGLILFTQNLLLGNESICRKRKNKNRKRRFKMGFRKKLDAILVDNKYRKRTCFHSLKLFHQIMRSYWKGGLWNTHSRGPRPWNLREIGLKLHLLRVVASNWTSWKGFAETLFFYNLYRSFFIWVREYVRYVVNYIVPSGRSCATIERLTNDTVPAAFVTRYLLRKLAQNFTWRQLIDPIIFELKNVMLYSTSSVIDKGHEEFESSNTYNFRNYIFDVIKFLINHCNDYLLRIESSRWFCIDTVNWILIPKINELDRYRVSYTLMNTAPLKIIGCSRELLVYFMGVDRLSIGSRHFVTDMHNSLLRSLYGAYQELADEGVFDADTFLWRQHIHLKRLRFDSKNRVIPDKIPETDYMKSRYRMNYNSGGVEGFKIQLGGRVTRKQRASSYQLTYGSMPLNTYSSFTDYAFYSLPLRNSEVTIRLWFNKGSNPLMTAGIKPLRKVISAGVISEWKLSLPDPVE